MNVFWFVKKKRYGKIEKNILEILQNYQKNKGYAEISLRHMVFAIKNELKTNSSKYNTVRNALNRLVEYNIQNFEWLGYGQKIYLELFY